MKRQIALYSFVYLCFIVLIAMPLLGIVIGAFQGGVYEFLQELTSPGALFSLKLTFEITGLTIMINTFFGILTALHIARRNIKGWQVLNAITDLPFAVSPVIAGLALILVYGPIR